MKKRTIISIIILILIALAIAVFLYFNYTGQDLTGSAVLNEYLYTTAICNNSNYCEDYEVECKGEEVVSLTLTGSFIQQEEEWQDKRENKELCDLDY